MIYIRVVRSCKQRNHTSLHVHQFHSELHKLYLTQFKQKSTLLGWKQHIDGILPWSWSHDPLLRGQICCRRHHICGVCLETADMFSANLVGSLKYDLSCIFDLLLCLSFSTISSELTDVIFYAKRCLPTKSFKEWVVSQNKAYPERRCLDHSSKKRGLAFVVNIATLVFTLIGKGCEVTEQANI